MKFIIVLVLVCSFFVPNISMAAEENHLYSTWDVIGVDAAASAWLIKHFVDKEAVFKFYPKGELIEEGLAFDTPDAEFRRKHGISCFEVIVNKYKVKDLKVLKMGEMIHKIEINFWNAELEGRVGEFSTTVKSILAENKDPHIALDKVFAVMDKLYANE